MGPSIRRRQAAAANQTVCECGFKRDALEQDKCSLRGLRHHPTFRPVCLLGLEDEALQWCNDLLPDGEYAYPTMHWAVMLEIEDFELVPRPHILARSRFNEPGRRSVVFEFEKGLESSTIHLPDCARGHTLILLYPDMRLGPMLRAFIHHTDASTATVIPAPLELILAYGDCIEEGSLRRCFECRKEGQGELPRCAKCRTAVYCGRECQQQAWQSHKKVCKHTTLIKQLIRLPSTPFLVPGAGLEYEYNPFCQFEATPPGVQLVFPRPGRLFKAAQAAPPDSDQAAAPPDSAPPDSEECQTKSHGPERTGNAEVGTTPEVKTSICMKDEPKCKGSFNLSKYLDVD